MLYEPTNVIPSTLTNSGTVASSDNIEVSWQVNGNSALSKFCIDFFQDNAYSTFVATTGIISDGCPFFGKNRYGETIPFSYSPLKPWSSLGAAGNNITDGNEYKLKITQFYAANNAIFKFSIGSSTTISQNTNYYFTYTVGSNTAYIGFSVGSDNSLFPANAELYYSDTYNVGWVYLPNSPRRMIVLYFGKYTAAPEGYLSIGTASLVTSESNDPFYGQAFIQASSFSAFITRTEPTLSITLTDQNGTALTSDTLTSATVYAQGNYSQAQGDAISWIRWQLTSTDNTKPPIDEDTGDVNTPITTYEYNGLFNGTVEGGENIPREYTLTCTIETLNGIQASAQKDFSVFYSENRYEGTFNAECLCDEDCNLLSWDPVEVIPGTAIPENGYTISDQQLTLQQGATVAWDEKYNSTDEPQAMNIAAPWTAVWKGKIGKTTSQFISQVKGGGVTLSDKQSVLRDDEPLSDEEEGASIDSIAFNPNGTCFVVGGQFTGYACLFRVNGTQVSYIQDLTGENGEPLTRAPQSISFHPDGNYFAYVSGGANNGIHLYRLVNGSASYVKTVPLNYASSRSAVRCAFSPNGNLLVVGTFEHGAQIFTVSATDDDINVTYSADIQNGQGSQVLTSIKTISFNNEGSLMVLGSQDGQFAECAALCAVSGTSVTFISYLKNNGENFDLAVNVAIFSPSGNTLLLGGAFDNYTAIYNIAGTTATYRGFLPMKNSSEISHIDSFSFLENGGILAVGGGATQCEVSFFMVSANERFFYKNSTQNSSIGSIISISAQGNVIVYGGERFSSPAGTSEYCELYFENASIATFSQTQNYNAFVNQAKTLLIISGDFEGNNSVFSIESNDFIYQGDVLDESGTAFSDELEFTFVSTGYAVGFDGNGVYLFSIDESILSYKEEMLYNSASIIADDIIYSPYRTSLVINRGSTYNGDAICFYFNSSQGTYSYAGQILKDGTPLQNIYRMYCSDYGKTLVITVSGAYVYVYTFTTTVNAIPNYVESDLEARFPTTSQLTECHFIFNEQGTKLVALLRERYTNPETYTVTLYSIIGNSNVTFLQALSNPYNGSIENWNAYPFMGAFTPDGSKLILGIFNGDNGGECVYPVFSISQNNAVYIQDLSSQIWKPDGYYMTFPGFILFISANAFIMQSRYFAPSSSSAPAVSDIELGTIQTTEDPSLLFSLSSDSIIVQKTGGVIELSKSGTTICAVEIESLANSVADEIIVKLSPTEIDVYSFGNGAYIGTNTYEFQNDFTQSAITSAQLTGYQVCDYFMIAEGNVTFLSLTDPNFYPSWNNDGTYTVELYANFIYGIDGGTGTSAGSGFRIYRSEQSSGEYKEIATLPSSVTSMKDYGIKSRKEYTYYLYVYDSNGAFMGVKQSNPVTHILPHFSIAVTQYNREDGAYHVLKEYRFACNIENMTISNNNNPSLSVNFTRYPTRYGITSNYASGTLQSLLGNVDKTYNKYYDTVELMDELNELSTSQYTLFLKDMKGHLYMISTSGAIQQTPTQKTREMQVSISVPWVEIGNAEYATILQLPTDDGWDSDEELLNVTLDVDMETGELIATYPYPYHGTSFVLAGDNNEILQAQTPIGITPADFQFSSEAVEANDGELTAIIKTK